ncbi:hypothetical protein [Brevibacillus agri]|uniref:hypothetical protein n=1 Tax=Brevibacillus agri TaxID=51101 RepID=UPI001EE61E3D|nr:hypothetical protein [Brevibacillus agri]MCG5251360.1 hypothetical protein [Brevibacillus agri]
MQQNKMMLSDDLLVLLNRLALNGDIRLAGHVLQSYIIRFWKIDSDTARHYVIWYFEKYYPKQFQRYLKKQQQR